MPNLIDLKKVSLGLSLTAGSLFFVACGGSDLEYPEFESQPTPTPTFGPEPTPTPEPADRPPPTLGDDFEAPLDFENFDLETGSTDPWGVNNATIAIVSNDVREGMYSLSVTGRTAEWNSTTYSLWDSEADAPILEPNTEYGAIVSVKMLSIAPVDPEAPDAPATVKLTMHSVGALENEYTTLAEGEVSTTDWVDMLGTFTTGDYVGVSDQYAYVESSGANSSYLVDFFQIGKALPTALDIANGDLETGEVAPWVGQGISTDDLSINNRDVKYGDYSLQVENREQNWQGPRYDLLPGEGEDPILATDTEYMVTAWVKMLTIEYDAESQDPPTDPDQETVRITLRTVPDLNNTGYTGVAEATVTTDEWVQLSGTFNTAGFDVSAATELFLYIEAGGANSSYLVDNLKIRPMPAAE